MSVDKRWLTAFGAGILTGYGAAGVGLCAASPYFLSAPFLQWVVIPAFVLGAAGLVFGMAHYARKG